MARELSVRHVVRGSLRREGTQIRLNLALIDGKCEVQRWAGTFDTERAQLTAAYAYSSKTFLLFVKRDFPAMLRGH